MDSIISLLTPKSATQFLKEDATVRQALETFDAHRFSVVPIVNEEGKYRGTLSEGDVLRFIKNQTRLSMKVLENITINEIDRYRPYAFVRVDALIAEVYALSLEQNFIPVVDDKDTYIGIITRREVLKYLSDRLENILESKE